MDPQRDVDVLLFDLGGVIVDFVGIDALQGLLRTPLQPSDIRHRWMASPIVRAFEVGALSRADFAAAFVRDWDLVLTPEQFLVEFRSWSRALLPGAGELLSALRVHYRLAALSNSNELHWERNSEEIGVTALFDLAMSSHQLGAHKPEPAIYAEAVSRLGLPAARVAFFDDVLANVEGARNAGLMAYQVCGVQELTECLRHHGFLGA